jgi:[amino group carrier protein]-lysine/ornithine hydrolase
VYIRINQATNVTIQNAETLIGLVKHYSPTGREAEAVSWLVSRMQALGYTRAFVDTVGNAVGIVGAGPRQIVLIGHIDTVPGEISVRVADGVLHGRGAVDAKGPMAAFTDAAIAAGAPPDWQIVVIGAIEEEGESRGAWGAVSEYHPQFAVIGEPSGWERITLGYKGVARFRFESEKEAGHTASGAESAAECAIACWSRLVELCSRENIGVEKAFDRLSPSLRGMKTESDGFADRAMVEGNLRLPVRVSISRVDELVRQAGVGATRAHVTGVPLPAYRAAKSTPLVSALLAAIRQEGGTPSFGVKLGTSDLCIVGPAWNCPMAVYGPGDSTLDHTPEERLSLAEYEKTVRVLTAVIRRLTKA